MDCLEFRRRLLIDPFCKDEDLTDHEAHCHDCAGFARDLRAQEMRMRAVLREAVPPEGLAERVQLAARFEQNASVRRRWWYAAAASVLMMVGVSMLSIWNTSLERSDIALAQSVINHIEDEAHHLREAQPVSDGRLKWVFKRFGAELAANIGPVNFAAECLMRKKNGVHLVLPGEKGPITVFFMPGELATSPIAVNAGRFQGEIVPTDWGSIAVVGEQGEALSGKGERLAAAVRWPASGLAGRSNVLGRGQTLGPVVAAEQ